MNFNGVDHVIKLYFKKEKITRQQVEIANHLMQLVLRKKRNNKTFRILDVRRGMLIESKLLNPNLTALVEGEALNLARIYSSISVP